MDFDIMNSVQTMTDTVVSWAPKIIAAILVLMGLAAERLLGSLRHRAKLLNRIAGSMMITAAALLGAKDVTAR